MAKSGINATRTEHSLDQSPWVQCDCCDDFMCNVHGVHTAECPCPPIDDWADSEFDPYLSSISPELLVWVAKDKVEDY